MNKSFELDITKEHCPMTFVKTKLKLDTLETGDQLTIRLKSGEPLENVPRSSEEQGHKVLSIRQITDDIHEVVVQKG
jgi:TusA-related sulfurtransferase